LLHFWVIINDDDDLKLFNVIKPFMSNLWSTAAHAWLTQNYCLSAPPVALFDTNDHLT